MNPVYEPPPGCVYPYMLPRGEGSPPFPPHKGGIYPPSLPNRLLCLRRWLCPVVKCIRRLRSARPSLLMFGETLSLRIGNQILVCLQVLRFAHLSCHSQFPHSLTARMATCQLWRAGVTGTLFHSTPPPGCFGVYLSNSSRLLDIIIFPLTFLDSLVKASKRS